MPVTRSAARALTTLPPASAVAPKVSKRKAQAAASTQATRKKARSNTDSEAPTANLIVDQDLPQAFIVPPAGPPPAVVPATLSFSFKDAKQHLINADERFRDVFEKTPCRPFEELEQVEPFR